MVDQTVPTTFDATIDNDDDEVVITEVKTCSNVSNTPLKSRKLVFSMEEKENIIGSEMLSDESIIIAQNLLKTQFPDIECLMDKVLGSINGFNVVPCTKRFIQILHTGN